MLNTELNQFESRVRLSLGVPPSTNNYYRSVAGKGVLISKRGREYRTEVASACSEYVGKFVDSDRLSILVVLRPPDHRKRDLDNFCGKALLDSLMKAGIFVDDSQIDCLTMVRGQLNRENPGVDVIISKL